jgi:hypothetical protein
MAAGGAYPSRGVEGSEEAETMDKVEAIRLALVELGAASNDELVYFARDRFGVVIELKYVPVIRATLKQRQLQADFLQSRAAATAAPTATSS